MTVKQLIVTLLDMPTDAEILVFVKREAGEEVELSIDDVRGYPASRYIYIETEPMPTDDEVGS